MGRAADKSPTEASFAGNAVTSDLPRFMRTVDMLSGAARSRDRLAHGALVGGRVPRHGGSGDATAFPGAIKIPVLMLAAARDEVVSTARSSSSACACAPAGTR